MCRSPSTMKASPSMSCWPRPTAPNCSRRRGCIDQRARMSEAVVDDVLAVLPPCCIRLRRSALSLVTWTRPTLTASCRLSARRTSLCGRCGRDLPTGRRNSPSIRAALEAASEAALASFAGLRAVQSGEGDLVAVFRALRHLPRAQEALYPLAAKFPPVSSFFLDPASRDDSALLARLADPAGENTGIIHDHNEPGSRGGFSIYVPEYYTRDRAWPMVMALHGGSGNGRNFLWSWLRDARSFGAIVVAPTAQRLDMGVDGRRHRYPEPDAHSGCRAQPLEYRSKTPAADRHERRRHVLLCQRARERLALHPSCAGRRHLPSADGGNCRSPSGCAACRCIWCTAGLTGCFRCRWRGRPTRHWPPQAPPSPTARWKISATAIRARSTRRYCNG